VVAVIDTGSGIKNKQSKNLFKANSNGLGLLVAHQNVKELGGTIGF